MEEEITLEQEFFARVFMHRVAVTGGVLMKTFIDKHSKGIALPPLVVEEVAQKYSNEVMQQAIQDGTFNDLYENAWDSIKDNMPEHLCVIRQ